VCLHQLLPKFQKDTGVEKVQCVVLTDGEAHQLPYRVSVQRHWEDASYLGMRSCHPDRTFLRDRKLGKTYKVGYGYHDFTSMLVTNLKDRFPSTNFIGIRVLQNRDAKSFMRLHTLQCLLTVLLKMQSLMLMMMQQKLKLKGHLLSH
jgi:hypothetical protein